MNFLLVAIREISQDRFTGDLPLFDKLRVTRSGVIPHQRLLPEMSLSSREGSLVGKDKNRIKFISLEINVLIT